MSRTSSSVNGEVTGSRFVFWLQAVARAVERERIVFGRRNLFLGQGGQHSQLAQGLEGAANSADIYADSMPSWASGC